MKNLDEIVVALDGSLKLLAFLLIVLVMVPATLISRQIKTADPFKMPRLFHRLILRVLDIKIRTIGTPSSASPVLFVANHSSYLDIPVLGSLLSSGFVAKAEVADWPLFGFLSKLQNSVFVERRSSRAAEQRALLKEYLGKKQNLVLFPEGTSSDGLTALPFKSSLFSIVEESAGGLPVTVQPISVTCVELDGFPLLREDRALYAWYGDMTMLPHLWTVFRRGHFKVEVIFHAPLTTSDYPNRKDLAAACQETVANGIAESLARRLPKAA